METYQITVIMVLVFNGVILALCLQEGLNNDNFKFGLCLCSGANVVFIGLIAVFSALLEYL